MKLSYAKLISPYSLYIPEIGHVKSLTLREIWDPSVTYDAYNFYLALMNLTPQTYYEKNNRELSEEDKDSLSMFDIISSDKELQAYYSNAFNLFLDEKVVWDDKNQSFITYLDKEECNTKTLVGMIHRDTFQELCDVILQINGVNNNSDYFDESKVKNKYALKLMKKFKKAPKFNKKKGDPKMELPNIISALSCIHKSVNIINVWDLTVFQVYDQFQRQQTNELYYIKSMSLAAWGDEKNKFDYTDWYKNQSNVE